MANGRRKEKAEKGSNKSEGAGKRDANGRFTRKSSNEGGKNCYAAMACGSVLSIDNMPAFSRNEVRRMLAVNSVETRKEVHAAVGRIVSARFMTGMLYGFFAGAAAALAAFAAARFFL